MGSLRHGRELLLVVLLCSLTACDDGGPAAPGGPLDGLPRIALDLVVEGLDNPLFLTAPPGDDRLFIVEQPGRIRIVKEGVLLPSPFLDLTGPVVSGGERGLLGLAFHPDYAANGRFYVSYTGSGGDSVIERYEVSGSPDLADSGSASLVLTVEQPQSNHNGGQLSFGPDGYLYVGMGDGGGAGDLQNHAQNRTNLLGTLLRLDVDGGEPYAIPADNPYADGAEGRAEIWAYGLRNPWRFWHDATEGLLYIADVGQNAWEEVNVVRTDAAGLNYGWRVMEGEVCYAAATCDQTGLTLPALTYPNGSGPASGCSVTGGVVNRGSAVPDLVGWYLYADFCAGWIRALRYANGQVEKDGQVASPGLGSITSFGTDGAGELYVVLRDGRVLRIREVNETT